MKKEEFIEKMEELGWEIDDIMDILNECERSERIDGLAWPLEALLFRNPNFEKGYIGGGESPEIKHKEDVV